MAKIDWMYGCGPNRLPLSCLLKINTVFTFGTWSASAENSVGLYISPVGREMVHSLNLYLKISVIHFQFMNLSVNSLWILTETWHVNVATFKVIL